MSQASRYGVIIPNGLMVVGAVAALAASWFTPMPNRIALFAAIVIFGVGFFMDKISTKA